MKAHLRIVLVSLVLAVSAQLNAQQMPIFTQFQQTLMFSNPAYAGMRKGICVNGVFRQQWAGFSDTQRGGNLSPQNYLLTVDSPIKFLHGGLGVSILQDNLAGDLWTDMTLQLSYSFHAELAFATLGIGLGANIVNRDLDGSLFDPVDDGDQIINTAQQSDMRADVNFGIYLMDEGRYSFGFAVSNILESSYKKLDPSGNDTGLKNDRTFTVTASYTIQLGNPLLVVEPSAMILTNLSVTQYNVAGTVTYNDRFWGGLNFRAGSFESIGVFVGMSIKSFSIGYAYDINMMGLSMPGSHEVHLGYCFKIKADRSKTSYKNTRYL